MNTETYINLVAIPPTVKSSATYTRTPVLAPGPYPPFSLPAPVSAPLETTHRVSPGDNLTKIVREHLSARGGNPTNAEVYDAVNTVARFNGLRNANLIHPGQTVDLSPLNSGHSQPANQASSIVAPLPAMPEAPRAVTPPLVESKPLDDPGAVAPAIVAPSSAPSDALLGTELTQRGGPVKIAANLMPEHTATRRKTIVTSLETRGAAGGPGPEPSDAALALQRVLNKTANALSVLKGLVDHDHGDQHSDNPWAGVLDGKARISSEYGMRKDPFNGEMAFHDGIDLAVKRGTDIMALKDGVVTFSGFKGGYGNTVIVRHEGGLETIYSHAARNHVSEGQAVTAGTVLADVGSTGRSTGPHLHFEVRKDGRSVNPLPYLKDSDLRLARKD
jgi:murein DD-endopeptidase MepM/ murein hydrolase activator NlpD